MAKNQSDSEHLQIARGLIYRGRPFYQKETLTVSKIGMVAGFCFNLPACYA